MEPIRLTLSSHLIPFAKYLGDNGEPIPRLLGAAGLPADCLDDPGTLIPSLGAVRFRDLAARVSGEPNVAAKATDRLGVSYLGGLGSRVLRAPSLFRALQTFRTLSGTQTNLLRVELSPARSGILFSGRFEFGSTPVEWNTHLYVLTWMLKVVRLATPDWSPSHICVQSVWDRSREQALRDMGANSFEFAATSSGFIVPWGLLSSPLLVLGGEGAPRRGGPGNGESWGQAPATTLRESLLQAIESYSNTGWLSVNQAAELSATSVRSMQRHLADDGSCFSEVLEEARFCKAKRLLLDSDARVGQVGRELGYRDHANFSRAFRAWAGVSPSAYRAQWSA